MIGIVPLSARTDPSLGNLIADWRGTCECPRDIGEPGLAMVRIRPALPPEHGALEDLQRRASLVAEEYREVLLAHPDAIALDPAEIAAGRVLVAAGPAGELLGFAAWLPLGEGEAELEGLFVEPARWRGGI
jgi:hypothetical protein